MIEDCRASDAEAVAAIYNHYVATTAISFETAPVSVAEMARRIEANTSTHPWLVWREDGGVLAYAYATRWRDRAAYAGSVETTVYVAEAERGRGLGRKVYDALLKRLADGGWRMAIGGIALPNEASIALHEALGFEKVAHFPEVGEKFGRLIDVGYWARRLRPA